MLVFRIIPHFGPSMQLPFKEYLQKQKEKLHVKLGTNVHTVSYAYNERLNNLWRHIEFPLYHLHRSPRNRLNDRLYPDICYICYYFVWTSNSWTMKCFLVSSIISKVYDLKISDISQRYQGEYKCSVRETVLKINVMKMNSEICLNQTKNNV